MENLGIYKTMRWSALALLIPVVGNIFVSGWSWTWNDFLFAFVFFVVMGTSIKWAMSKTPQAYRVAVGALVFLGFAFVWGMLATG